MSSRIAIVIPFYKLTFFRECLQSLEAQTDKRFHIYIGNDASTEDPSFLLQEYRGKIDFTYKRFENNIGTKSLTKQWDRCIAMMKDEDWFMILGDDDYLSLNAVEEFYKHVAHAEKEKISVIKLNSAVVDENSIVTLEKKSEPLIKSAIEHFFDKYIYEGRSSLSEHIFRKSEYERFGFTEMPFAWHSDDLALLQFSSFGSIMFLIDAKCYVRVSTESISGNRHKNKKEKRQATQIFFTAVLHHHRRFTKTQKRKLFDLIEWYEKEKDIRIIFPNRLSTLCTVYGWKGLIKAIK